MHDDDHTTQSNRKQSFTEEMQQAFVDWVHRLPFIRKENVRDPERGPLEVESTEQTSASSPTDSMAVRDLSNDKGIH